VTVFSAVQQPSESHGACLERAMRPQGQKSHLSVSQTKLSQAEAYVFARFIFGVRYFAHSEKETYDTEGELPH
jgi:hypothetical protein